MLRTTSRLFARKRDRRVQPCATTPDGEWQNHRVDEQRRECARSAARMTKTLRRRAAATDSFVMARGWRAFLAEICARAARTIGARRRYPNCSTAKRPPRRLAMFVRMIVAVMVTLACAARAGAGPIVSVPGTSNPWLAGMPDGTTADVGDVAPAQSPVLVPIVVTPGDLLSFFADGATDHCPAFGCGAAGAEGDAGEGASSHAIGAEHGIGNIIAPIDALLGVFLGPAQPDLSPAPGLLDFGTAASRDFAFLAPLLQQPFFIGDGFRNDGVTPQTFIVPAGATRLFLGTMDGYEWNNNSGGLRVTVNTVPEPATLTLVGIGLVALRRRRSIRKQD
jgi:hypothetical protein